MCSTKEFNYLYAKSVNYQKFLYFFLYMGQIHAEEITTYLNSPLNSDKKSILERLNKNDAVVRDFGESQLHALVMFIISSDDTYCMQEVLKLFLKCNFHRLSMFDDDLVPFFIKCIYHSSAELRLYALSNLSIMSENSKQVVRTLLCDPKPINQLIVLTRDDQINGEIKRQALIFLVDVTKEYFSSNVLRVCAVTLVNALCEIWDKEEGTNLIEYSLRIMENLAVDKDTTTYFLQNNAVHSFLHFTEDPQFMTLPSKIVTLYFQVLSALFENHAPEVINLILEGSRTGTFVRIVIESLDNPNTATQAARCLTNVVDKSAKLSALICSNEYINLLVKSSILSEFQEVRDSVTELLCSAQRKNKNIEWSSVLSAKSVEIVSSAVVTEYKNQSFDPNAIILLYTLLETKIATKNLLAESQNTSEGPLLPWLVTCLSRFTYDCIHNFQNQIKAPRRCYFFHLWMFRVVIQWIDESPVCASRATNIMSLTSPIISFFAGSLDTSVSTYSERHFFTLGIVCIFTLYNATCDEKWLQLLRCEAQVRRIYECCEPCLKESFDHFFSTNDTLINKKSPFCSRFRQKIDVVFHIGMEQFFHRKIECYPYHTKAGESQLESENTLTQLQHSTLTESDLESLNDKKDDPLLLSQEEISEDASKINSNNFTEKEMEISASSHLPECSYETIKDFENRLSVLEANHRDEVHHLRNEIHGLKEENGQIRAELSKIQTLVEAMNAFQGLE